VKYKKRFDPSTLTDEKLLDELKKLAEKLKRAPSQNDIKKYGNDITKRVYLYRKRFGSLQIAQEKVGYNKNLGGNDLKYNDGDMLDEILKVKDILNKTPTQQEIRKYGKYPADAYKRHFGTYNNALKKVGLRHNVKYGQNTEDIKKDIISVSKLLGRTPTTTEFNKYSNTVSGATAANKIDGYRSWNATLKKCGLEVLHNKNLTEEELKDEVVRLKKELNRIPGYYDMVQLGKYSAEAYAYKYGSYVKALHYFGFDYIPQNQWQNQKYTRAKDGIMYRSLFEASISDILFDLQSKKQIVSYTYEKKVCEKRQWSCDFCIDVGKTELWLEADGMGKNRPEIYDNEHEKIKYYIENNMSFYILKYRNRGLREEIADVISRMKG
jgi:hypothetical protein